MIGGAIIAERRQLQVAEIQENTGNTVPFGTMDQSLSSMVFAVGAGSLTAIIGYFSLYYVSRALCIHLLMLYLVVWNKNSLCIRRLYLL